MVNSIKRMIAPPPMVDLDIDQNGHSGRWKFCGGTIPRSEIVYFTQVAFCLIVVITAIVNLTIYKDTSDAQLWTALLTAHVGYLLPSPSLKSAQKSYG